MFTRITYIKVPMLYVEAKGRLDIYSVADYLSKIKEQLSITGVKELVLEFSEIESVASIGLRAILELHKTMQEKKGHLRLKNVNKEILEAFKFTGFDNFLIIENDAENV